MEDVAELNSKILEAYSDLSLNKELSRYYNSLSYVESLSNANWSGINPEKWKEAIDSWNKALSEKAKEIWEMKSQKIIEYEIN